LWLGYDELYGLLEKEGYNVKFLGLRDIIKEHIEDINNCEIIVCGDTFGMHIALALKKKVVALFNCTPPNEIYSYGRMIKLVSPLYEDYFYKKEPSAEAMSAIPIEHVYTAVKELLKGDKIH
jgi:ADP-heptose:LPS heptosyltransferase